MIDDQLACTAYTTSRIVKQVIIDGTIHAAFFGHKSWNQLCKSKKL